MAKKSWQTSAAGIGAILSAVGLAIQYMNDGDPATNPEWGALVPAIIAGLGLIFARDNKVTSEDVGAKK